MIQVFPAKSLCHSIVVIELVNLIIRRKIWQSAWIFVEKTKYNWFKIKNLQIKMCNPVIKPVIPSKRVRARTYMNKKYCFLNKNDLMAEAATGGVL